MGVGGGGTPHSKTTDPGLLFEHAPFWGVGGRRGQGDTWH